MTTTKNAKEFNPLGTIAEMHADFANTCIPKGAGEPQRTSMEQAFYCGVVAMLSAFGHLAENVPEPIAQKIYENWVGELELYKLRMGIEAAAQEGNRS